MLLFVVIPLVVVVLLGLLAPLRMASICSREEEQRWATEERDLETTIISGE